MKKIWDAKAVPVGQVVTLVDSVSSQVWMFCVNPDNTYGSILVREGKGYEEGKAVIGTDTFDLFQGIEWDNGGWFRGRFYITVEVDPKYYKYIRKFPVTYIAKMKAANGK